MKSFEEQAAHLDRLIDTKDVITKQIDDLEEGLTDLDRQIYQFKYSLIQNGIHFRGRTPEQITRIAEMALSEVPLLQDERPEYHEDLVSIVSVIKQNTGEPALLAEPSSRYRDKSFLFTPFVVPTYPRFSGDIWQISHHGLCMPLEHSFSAPVGYGNEEVEENSELVVSKLLTRPWDQTKAKIFDAPEEFSLVKESEQEKPSSVLWIGGKAVVAALQYPDFLLIGDDQFSGDRFSYWTKGQQAKILASAVKMFVQTGALKPASKKKLAKTVLTQQAEAEQQLQQAQDSRDRSKKRVHRLGREHASEEAKHLARVIRDDDVAEVQSMAAIRNYWRTIGFQLEE